MSAPILTPQVPRASAVEFGRLRQVNQPTQCLTLRSGKGVLRPPYTPQLAAPLPQQRAGGVRRPPDPAAGASGPVLALLTR